MILDSHTLLWWLEQSDELSVTARDILADAAKGESTFHVAAISFWELYRKERHGILTPRISVRQWPGLLRSIEWLRLEDDSPEIWLAMADLDWAHQDPADRLIATIARRRGVSVLTRDRRFHAPDSPVSAVW